MKTLYNIFQTEKITSEKKEIPKEKIIIDYREKNSLVASELIKLGFEIEFRELKVADYLVKNTAIERKTVGDFISSMINRRLYMRFFAVPGSEISPSFPITRMLLSIIYARGITFVFS